MSAVRFGALFMVVVYLGLLPAHAVMLTGQVRLFILVLTAVALVVSGLAAVATTVLPERRVPGLVGLLFALPIVTTEAQLAATRELELTAVLMLVMVAIGALAISRRSVVVGLAAAIATWAVIVVVRDPQPADQVGLYAVQLALAGGLAGCMFIIRERTFARLDRARRRNNAQRDELDVLRAQAAADLERLSSLVQASPLGLALSDEHGLLVQVNRAVCQMVGLPASDLLGKGASSFTHPDDLEFISRSGEAIASAPDGVAKIETRYVRSDGEVIWVWLTLTHVPGPAGEVWTLAHVQDITDRKASDERLRQSLQVIEAAGIVSHTVQLGEDPRRVIVEQTRKIADASSVQFIEKLGEDQLVVTTSDGHPDLTGTVISMAETSMSVHVWRTAETVFIDEAHGHPKASPRLLEQANAQSAMWVPALVDGEVVAIVSIVWSQRVGRVTELQRTAVDTIVAESALAMMSERMRHSLEEWSMTDPLTGLLNRRGWEREVSELNANRRVQQWPTIVALLDFDHFKAYNDTLGHAAGDAALSGFGTALTGARRPKDLVARWGGEEFAIALTNCPADAAPSALERLARCVPGDLTCSVGWTVLQPDEDMGVALKRADKALYVAKDSGRDQIRGDVEPATEPSY